MSHTHSTLSRWLAGHVRRPPPTLAACRIVRKLCNNFSPYAGYPFSFKVTFDFMISLRDRLTALYRYA